MFAYSSYVKKYSRKETFNLPPHNLHCDSVDTWHFASIQPYLHKRQRSQMRSTILLYAKCAKPTHTADLLPFHQRIPNIERQATIEYARTNANFEIPFAQSRDIFAMTNESIFIRWQRNQRSQQIDAINDVLFVASVCCMSKILSFYWQRWFGVVGRSFGLSQVCSLFDYTPVSIRWCSGGNNLLLVQIS